MTDPIQQRTSCPECNAKDAELKEFKIGYDLLYANFSASQKRVDELESERDSKDLEYRKMSEEYRKREIELELELKALKERLES